MKPTPHPTQHHTVERQSDGREFISYTTRYPPPYTSARSSSPLFYSVNIGPVHLIALTSYTNYTRVSAQVAWLKEDLSMVDRESTPWVIVTLHAPIVNSYFSHYQENECMRLEVGCGGGCDM